MENEILPEEIKRIKYHADVFLSKAITLKELSNITAVSQEILLEEFTCKLNKIDMARYLSVQNVLNYLYKVKAC